MRVVICDTPYSATRRVADQIIDQIAQNPKSVLGLATGGTMQALYPMLVEAHRMGLSFARLTCFNLDEYVGLPNDHPQSYAYYVRTHLFDHVDLRSSQCFVPNGLGNLEVAAHDYEKLIADHGPIDLQLLGLGENGHIGFNEPGSALTSRTREKALSRATLSANRRFFDTAAEMPQAAITMGIGTIQESCRAVLLAVGTKKAEAVKAMVEGPVSAFCPASALQMHQHVTAVFDADAARLLQLREHYIHAEEIQAERDRKK